MASTTTLTAFEPGNSTGSLHVNFSLYSSTPDSGNVYDGMGDFYVVRSGSVIHRWRGLVGGFATAQDGDILYAKYYDSSGVAGDFASYTFTLASTWDGTLYVDSGWGGTQSGTLAEPYATFAAAQSAYAGAFSANEKWRILLKRGGTYTSTGLASTNWITLSSTAHHLELGDYDSGAKPALTLTTSGNGSCLVGGPMGAQTLTLKNLAVTGAGSGTSSQFVNCNTTPVASSTEANVTALDCDVVGCELIYVGPYSTGYTPNRIDYHAMVGCTFDDWGATGGGHAHTNLSAAAYVLMLDCTWLEQIDANGFIRNNRLRYSAYINNTFDRTGSTFKYNVFRLGGGGGTVSDDTAHHVLVSGNQFLECDEAIEIEAAQHDDECRWAYIDVLDNHIYQTTSPLNFPINFGGESGTVSLELIKVRVLGNQAWSVYPMVGIGLGGDTADTGHIESLLIANNTVVISGINTTLLQFGGTNAVSTVVDSASVTLKNNYAYCTGGGGTAKLIEDFANAGAGVTTVAMFTGCDNNFIRTASGSLGWWRSSNLAAWQSASSQDGSSNIDTSSSHNLTSITASTFDARPASGTGPQIGTGDGTVLIDADGNLFVDDAGAFEYGGSAPMEPSGGGGGGGSTLYPDTALSISIGIGI